MADTKTEAIYTIRIEDGPALLKLEKQTRQLAEVRAERVRLNKEIRESIAKEAELAKAIDKGGAEAEGAAKQLANLTAKRDEDARALADQDLKFTKLSGTTRELKNDLSGLTEAGLRFRDKMADATLQALRQSGALEQLSARGEALQNDIKGVNVALEKNAATLATLEVAYRKGETTEAEYLRQQKLLEKENEALAASNDKLGQELGQVTTKLDKAEQQVKQLNAEFQAGKISQEEYRAGLQRIEDTTKGLGGKFDDFVKNQGKELKSTLSSVALQYVGVGAAIYGVQQVLGSAVNAVVDFDAALAKVKALGGDYRKDIDALGNAARELGPKFGIGVSEAVGAVEALAKAGVSSGDILSGGLEGALTLAAAGSLEVGKAAEIASSALTQFGLSGADVTMVADLLAGGALNAQGSVEDLGAALNQSGLVAANFGIPVDEAVGALSAFASAGLLGSDAGTSFKTMLQSLTPRSKEAADKMKELGLDFFDAQGQFIGLEGVAGQLQDRLKGLTQEQQQAALKTIFGSDAVRAATVLYNQGATGVAEWTDKVSKSGTASEVAQANLDSLAGSFATANAKWQSFVTGIDNGNGILSRSLRAVVGGFGEILDLLGRAKDLGGIGDVFTPGGIAAAGTFRDAMEGVNKAIATAKADADKYNNSLEGMTAKLKGLEQQKALNDADGFYAAAEGVEVQIVALRKLIAAKQEEGKAATEAAKNEGDGAGAIDTATNSTKTYTEAIRIVTGSIADYQAQIRSLQEQQSQSTTSAQFAAYQAQIDALNNSVDLLTGNVVALPDLNSLITQAPENANAPAEPPVLDAEVATTAGIALTLDERKSLYEDEKQAFEAVQDAKIAAIGGFASALGNLAKEGSGAAKVLLALEKASAIGQIVINTQREISSNNANPAWSLLPDGGLALKTAANLAARIRAATSIGIIGAQAIAGFAEGGDISGNVTPSWGIPIRRANGDNVLVQAGDRWITLKGNEKVLNQRQQRKAEAIAGPSIWSDIGVPGYRAGKTGFAGGGVIGGKGGGVTYSAGTGIRAPLEDLIGDVMRLEIASIQRSIRAGLGGFVGGVDTLVSALGTPRPSPESVVAGDLSTVMRMFAERPISVSVEEINRVQQQVHVTDTASRA